MGLLRNLQPTWWFAAHLHTRFEACVRHDPAPETMTATSPPSSSSGHLPRADNPDEITIDDNEEEGVTSVAENSRSDTPSRGAMVPKVAESIPPPPPQNPDEITLDDEIEAVEPPPPPPPPLRETKFLALDKCLPHRQFLEASPPPGNAKTNQLTYFCPCDNHQVVDIPTQEQERGREGGERPRDAVVLCYDPEWLAITRAFQPYLSRKHKQATYPSPDDAHAAVSREWDWVHAHVPPKLNLGTSSDGWRVDACQRFVVPSHAAGGTGVGHPYDRGDKSAAALAQTEAFTALLEVENVVAK